LVFLILGLFCEITQNFKVVVWLWFLGFFYMGVWDY